MIHSDSIFNKLSVDLFVKLCEERPQIVDRNHKLRSGVFSLAGCRGRGEGGGVGGGGRKGAVDHEVPCPQPRSHGLSRLPCPLHFFRSQFFFSSSHRRSFASPRTRLG